MLQRLPEISCRQPSALAPQPRVAQADTNALEFLALVFLALLQGIYSVFAVFLIDNLDFYLCYLGNIHLELL